MTAAATARMADFARRPLTAGEFAIARVVFADRIVYDRVRIVQASIAPWGAMVPFGRSILFGRWRAPLDFTDTDVFEQGWFVHEMAHVWQAAEGVVLAYAKLSALGSSAYRVSLEPGKPLRAYGIEAQAEIARFVFLARTGRPDPNAPPRAALEALWPISRPSA